MALYPPVMVLSAQRNPHTVACAVATTCARNTTKWNKLAPSAEELTKTVKSTGYAWRDWRIQRVCGKKAMASLVIF